MADRARSSTGWATVLRRGHVDSGADWRMDADDLRLYPRSGGISLGRPIAATGLHMFATLAAELPAIDGAPSLATMCNSSGQALAEVFERV